MNKRIISLLLIGIGTMSLIGCNDNNKQPSYATNKEQQYEQRKINDSDRDVYRCVDDKRTMESDGLLNGDFELLSTEILDDNHKVIYVLKYKETGKRYMYIVYNGAYSPTTNLIALD